jgi:hypothetical protein
MIKTINVINKSKENYLYDNETKILLKMLNNGIEKLIIKDKCFNIKKTGNNTAIVNITKIKTIIFFKTYNVLTTLKIKYN